MQAPLRTLFKFAFGLSPSEATFERRGCRSGDCAAREHLECVGVNFLRGYNKALEDRGGDALAAALDAELTMAVAGRGALGCDVERACARTPEVWRELLGAGRYGLARLIAAERGEDEAAATRVWAALESLKKAGANVVAPGVLHSAMDDGWVQLQAGGFRVATYAAKVAGADERLALAVCREWANGGAAN